jgi:hypothetical protein
MKPTKQNKLVLLLNNRNKWMTAKQCCKLLNQPMPRGLRTVRSMAEHSQGRVISGQEGYKHVIWATVDDLCHATAKLRSQAAKMNKRANQIERQWERE